LITKHPSTEGNEQLHAARTRTRYIEHGTCVHYLKNNRSDCETLSTICWMNHAVLESPAMMDQHMNDCNTRDYHIKHMKKPNRCTKWEDKEQSKIWETVLVGRRTVVQSGDSIPNTRGNVGHL